MTPIYSEEAEQSVIGGLLISPDSYDQIHWLQPESFYVHANRKLFMVISQMIAQNKPVDMVTVAEELGAALDEIGGFQFLGALAQNIPSAANIMRYAEVVHDRALVRQLKAKVKEIELDLESPGDVAQKVERAQQAFTEIGVNSQDDPVFLGDLVWDCMDYIEKVQNGNIVTRKTGLIDLDKKIGGFEGGQLIIIAGRPSMGKTALAVQLADCLQTPDESALVFSCEMKNRELVLRKLSTNAKVSTLRLRNGELDDEDFNRLSVATEKVKKLNMLVDDKAITLNSMLSKARTIKRKYGLSCVVVDYLQLMDGPGDSRESQISTLSRGFKAMAKELDVPVFVLSQLNRKVEDRANKRPTMSDLRESGAIEQDADIVALIYRDDYYNPDSQYKGTAEVIIAKQRSGEVGTVILSFDKEHTVFHNFVGALPEPRPIKNKRGFFDEE